MPSSSQPQPAHCTPSLQLQLKHAALMLLGLILIIATVIEIVVSNVYFDNI